MLSLRQFLKYFLWNIKLNKLDFDQVNSYSIQNIHANVKSGKIIGTLIRLILYGFVKYIAVKGNPSCL